MVDFQSDLKEITMEYLKLVSKDANKVWLRWKAFFLDILDKHAAVTKIKVKRNSLPYVTSELRALIKTRDYLRAKANKTGSECLRQAFNNTRNKVNKLLSDLQKNYYSKKIEENKDNLKGTWKILKQAMGQESKSSTIEKVIHKGYEISDKKEIANFCNEHFVSVGKRLAVNIPDTGESPAAHIKPTSSRFVFHKVMTFQVEEALKKLIKSKATGIHNTKRLAVNISDTGESPAAHIKPTSSRFVFHEVMTFQVEKALKKLIKSKATGIHNIPKKILKDSCQVIAPFLTDIFNFSITSDIFPDDLKVGKVSPVHKSGDRDDLTNYRPITILPTIARVFERLLYDQMYTYLAENKLLGNQQFGFRSIHSTALALGKSVNTWLMNVDNGKLNSSLSGHQEGL